jgi:hypothetical protein
MTEDQKQLEHQIIIKAIQLKLLKFLDDGIQGYTEVENAKPRLIDRVGLSEVELVALCKELCYDIHVEPGTDEVALTSEEIRLSNLILSEWKTSEALKTLINVLKQYDPDYFEEDEEGMQMMPALLANFGFDALLPIAKEMLGESWAGDAIETMMLFQAMGLILIEFKPSIGQLKPVTDLFLDKIKKYRTNNAAVNSCLVRYLIDYGHGPNQFVKAAFSEGFVNAEMLKLNEVGMHRHAPVEKLLATFKTAPRLSDHEFACLNRSMQVQGSVFGHYGYILGALLAPSLRAMPSKIIENLKHNPFLDDDDQPEEVQNCIGHELFYFSQIMKIYEEFNPYQESLFPLRDLLLRVEREVKKLLEDEIEKYDLQYAKIYTSRIVSFVTSFIDGLYLAHDEADEDFLNADPFLAELESFYESISLYDPQLPDSVFLEQAQRAKTVSDVWEKGYVGFAARVRDFRRAKLAVMQDYAPLKSNKIGRNDPCVCGSGKKFKKCCLT